MSDELTTQERDVLRIVQSDFPVTKTPYSDIGDNLGLSEDEVIAHISNLTNRGIIRKLGAVIAPIKMGYVSCLLAMDVPEEELENIASIINSYNGVTHNYVREGSPNIWFTIIEPDDESLNKTVKDISAETKKDVMRMPIEKRYKIGVKFDI